jgi:hypothetical protein
MSERYTIKLTAKQIDAIYSAITIYEGSYDGISQEELRDWGVTKVMLSLRQIETKLDKAIGYVAEGVGA